MDFTNSNTIGKLAPTPVQILQRFRTITETNVNAPPSLDTAMPIVPVLDVGRRVGEIVQLAAYSSNSASSITQSWNTTKNPEVFKKIRASTSVRFNSVSYGYGGTGTGLVDVGAFVRYGGSQFADTYLNIGQAEIDVFAAGLRNANYELMQGFSKEFPSKQLVSWADGNSQFEGEEEVFIEEILFIQVLVTGFSPFCNSNIAMEILY